MRINRARHKQLNDTDLRRWSSQSWPRPQRRLSSATPSVSHGLPEPGVKHGSPLNSGTTHWKQKPVICNVYLLRGRGLAGANGPHGLISQNHFAPVLHIVWGKISMSLAPASISSQVQTEAKVSTHTCDDFGLSEHDLLGDASLPLVQFLTDAGDHAQTVLQSVGRLLSNQLNNKTTNESLKNHLWETLGVDVFTSSLSPKTWRLSECPRITQCTPQSLIMAGLTTEDVQENKSLSAPLISVLRRFLSQQCLFTA